MKEFWSDSSSFGKLAILIGLLAAVPVIILPWYPEDLKYALSFLVPGSVSILFGLITCIFGKTDSEGSAGWRSQAGQSSLTILFAWTWGPLVGALPFIFGKQLTVLQALYEALSGWTTTGLSVMDVPSIPMIFLFYRSFMQYCGGLGFIVMMMLITTNKQSMILYSAEGHPDKIMPNIKKTAQMIFVIYNVCLILGSISCRIAGMTWFESICHCMCTLSTGGFSTKLNYIGEYHSFAIEIITIILMLIGTTNFVALLLLARRKFRSFFSISDVKFHLILLAIFIPPTAVLLSHAADIGLVGGFRESAFVIISALSTTGYPIRNLTEWPAFGIGILILMMVIGGEIGSTSGGIKLSRVYLLFRISAVQIRKKLSPSSNVESLNYVKASGKMPIDQDLAGDTISYVIIYLAVFVIGSLLMTVTADCTLTEAMFDFASALSNVGLSVGITGPGTNAPTLIVEMIGMILGRLEIFIVVIGCKFGFEMLKNLVIKKSRS